VDSQAREPPVTLPQSRTGQRVSLFAP
jgi:hypothetical protein